MNNVNTLKFANNLLSYDNYTEAEIMEFISTAKTQ